MTAAQLAREFSRLKDAQRLLRFCERECGALGPSSVRLDVIEQMRILARLIALHVVPLC